MEPRVELIERAHTRFLLEKQNEAAKPRRRRDVLRGASELGYGVPKVAGNSSQPAARKRGKKFPHDRVGAHDAERKRRTDAIL